MHNSKAQNLIKLKNKKINVPEFLYFKVSDFKKNKSLILKNIKKRFKGLVAVRSSASDEDSKKNSLAGYYSSFLNVPSANKKMTEDKINLVIESYKRGKGRNNEVLVQKMVKNIKISGVLLSRDINNYNPCYVINYFKGDDTSAVTSGKRKTKSIKFFVNKKYNLKYPFNKLIIIVEKIKKIFNSDIDVEFIIDNKNNIHIVQARNLYVNKIIHNKNIYNNKFFLRIFSGLEKKIFKLKKKHHNLFGNDNFFGVMPDWNPAEIIGKKPKPLALSLYKELVTDHIWSENRANYGFSNLKQFHLMTTFYGTPYIDVRIDFNSWLPKDLDNTIKKKLVNFYLNKFKNNKNYHDKIEKEIIFSCYSFNTNERIINELKNILSLKEKKLLIKSLKKINKLAYEKKIIDLNKIEKLKDKQKKVEKSNLYFIDKIYWHIEECKEFGTLPFAGLARCGFIAIELLNSMVLKKIISTRDKDLFLRSINNISSSIIEDFKNFNKKMFLKKYGHLRPDTYEITSLNYSQAYTKYFKKNSKIKKTNKNFHFKKDQIKKIEKYLKSMSFYGGHKNFINFIKDSIWAREYSKFVFAKSIDLVFKNLELFGKKLNISKKKLSYLDINDILNIYYNLSSENLVKSLKNKIRNNLQDYNVNKIIQLPDVIINPKDIYLQDLRDNSPNFITNNITKGEIKKINVSDKKFDLINKIVCIENADPGFDFIFSHKIKGLITKYGGFNSHMSIRCSELSIPAAIGVGDEIFESLSNKNRIELNCENKKLILI